MPKRSGLLASRLHWFALLPALVCVSVLEASDPQRTQEAQGISGGTGLSGVVLERGHLRRSVPFAVVTLRGRGFEARIRTDKDGRFAFLDVPPGAGYTLSAVSTGYVPGFATELEGTWRQSNLTIRSGVWLRDVPIFLWRSGAIAGQVRDEQGAPLVGAMIQLLSVVDLGRGDSFAQGSVVFADDRGHYSFGALPPGSYVVVVRNGSRVGPWISGGLDLETGRQALLDSNFTEIPVKGFLRPVSPEYAQGHVYANTYYPGTWRLQDAAVVRLEAGQITEGVDVALQPLPAGPVSGTIRHRSRPLKEVALRLLHADELDLGEGMEVASATSDSAGRFYFPMVPHGTYRLDVSGWLSTVRLLPAVGDIATVPPSSGGFESQHTVFLNSDHGVRLAVITSRAGTGVWGSALIEVGSAGVSNIEVEVVDGVRLSGRVTVEPDTTPDAGVATLAQLLLLPATSGLALPVRQLVRLGSDGQFQLAGVRPGVYFLDVAVISSATTAVRHVRVNGVDYSAKPIELMRDTTEVDVVVGSNLGSITGRVTMAPGAVSASPGVVVVPSERHWWSVDSVGRYPRFRVATVDGDGGYKVDSLPPGDYSVIAVSDLQTFSWPQVSPQSAGVAGAISAVVGWAETVVANLSLVRK